MSDQPRLWPWYSKAAVAKVQRRLESGANLGAQARDEDVLELERVGKEVLAPAGYEALSFSSGTSALFATYVSLGLAGSRVLAPTYAFRASITSLLAAGAEVEFYDSDRYTGEPDLSSVPDSVLRRCDALLMVHMNGLVPELSPIKLLCQKYGLKLVVDASHSHGALDSSGNRIGDSADAVVYSIGTTKLVSGGLGGLAFYRDDAARNGAMVLGQAKWRALDACPQDQHARVGAGYHHRISPISAILATDHLSRLTALLSDKDMFVSRVSEMIVDRCGASLKPVRPIHGGLRQGLYKLHLRANAAVRVAELVDTWRKCGARARVPSMPLHREPGIASIAGCSYPMDGADKFLSSVIELDGFDMHDLTQLDDVLRRVAMACKALE